MFKNETGAGERAGRGVEFSNYLGNSIKQWLLAGGGSGGASGWRGGASVFVAANNLRVKGVEGLPCFMQIPAVSKSGDCAS